MRLLSATLLLLVVGLAGCGAGIPSTINPPAVSVQNVTGNWQIQSGSTVATGATATGVLLLGDLVSSNTSVTGTFRFSDLAQGNACGALNQVITVTGSVDATNPLAQVLNLTSSPFNGSVLTAQLTLFPMLQGSATGTIQVKGSTCTLASSPAIGALFPPTNGTYVGTLSPAGSTTGAAGTATLTVAQATSPSADGQFAVTGTLQFTGAGCNASAALTGTASGILVRANSTPTLTSYVDIFASQPTPGLPQNLFTSLFILSPSCPLIGAQYSGMLNKQ